MKLFCHQILAETGKKSTQVWYCGASITEGPLIRNFLRDSLEWWSSPLQGEPFAASLCTRDQGISEVGRSPLTNDANNPPWEARLQKQALRRPGSYWAFLPQAFLYSLVQKVKICELFYGPVESIALIEETKHHFFLVLQLCASISIFSQSFFKYTISKL